MVQGPVRPGHGPAALPNQGTTQQGAGTLLTPGAQLDAFDATTGKIVWVWGIPNDTGISPTVTYSYKGKQYLASYHGVAIAGHAGCNPDAASETS